MAEAVAGGCGVGAVGAGAVGAGAVAAAGLVAASFVCALASCAHPEVMANPTTTATHDLVTHCANLIGFPAGLEY